MRFLVRAASRIGHHRDYHQMFSGTLILSISVKAWSHFDPSERRQRSFSDQGHLGANLERIVRSSHKPCLVTSDNFQPISKIMLAYDGGKSCQKALQFLLESPAFKDMEFHLLTVAKKQEDKAAMSFLQTAEIKARTAGFAPICQIIHGEAKTVIANYIEKQDINLLIMGAYGHSRIRHLVIGSTTAQMLRSSHIPVLLFR